MNPFDSNARYEIEAHAFNLMTGHMAPGKDSPATAGPTDYEEREREWITWKKTNRICIDAMMAAFIRVYER